jgi:hypothetical protein
VCEDQRVIRTSDGAEAGRVEYIVVEPESRQIVSTVITGGVEGARLVAVPFQSLRFQGEREVTLTEITRERLVSAPVIEKTQLTSTTRFEPALIERSFTHFNVRADAATTTRERATTETDATRRTTEQPGRTTRESTAATTRERATTETDATRRTTEQPGRATRESAAKERETAPPPVGERLERKDSTTDRSPRKAEREPSESAKEKAPADRSETKREDKPGRELPEEGKVNRPAPKDADRPARAGEERNPPKETPSKELQDQPKKAPAEKSDKPVREETEKPERTPPK